MCLAPTPPVECPLGSLTPSPWPSASSPLVSALLLSRKGRRPMILTPETNEFAPPGSLDARIRGEDIVARNKSSNQKRRGRRRSFTHGERGVERSESPRWRVFMALEMLVESAAESAVPSKCALRQRGAKRRALKAPLSWVTLSFLNPPPSM